jgi:phosphate-selective porin OprO/OprP
MVVAAVGVLCCGSNALAQSAAPAPGAPVEAAPPPAPPVPPAPVPPGEAPAVERPAWQDRIDALEQRTHALEAEVAQVHQLPPPPPPVPARPGATVQADENGFSITSADRQYQIRFKGLFQVDGRRFFDDTTLGNSDTFLLRRARPILAGTLLGLTDFYVAPDFGNNTVALLDAYLDVHPFPWLRFRAGKFKPPLGLERLQADQDVTFNERALDSNLTAQREVGLELWGDIAGGILRYEGAIVNGNPDNGINDIDSDHAKSFEGRIFLQPFNTDALKPFGRLGVGIAAGTGNEKGSATNTWVGAFKSPGQNTIFSYLSTTTATTVFASGRHTRINPQLYYYVGPFGLLAEWVREYQQLANSVGSGAVNNSAGHVTAAFVIGGDETFEGVKPHHALDLANGGYGALEIAGRYHWLDVDHASFSTAADPSKSIGRARAAGVALNWQLSRNIKASGNFDQTWFDGGASKGANRNTEKVTIGRFEIAF